MHARELVEQVRVEHPRRGAQHFAAAHVGQLVRLSRGHAQRITPPPRWLGLSPRASPRRPGPRARRGERNGHVARRSSASRAEGLDLDVREGDEVALRRVQIVGEPAPIAVPRHPQDARTRDSAASRRRSVRLDAPSRRRYSRRTRRCHPGRMARSRQRDGGPCAGRRTASRRPTAAPCAGATCPALSEHMLIVPEGDSARRRHAHTELRAGRAQAGAAPEPRRVAAHAAPPAEPVAAGRRRRCAAVGGRVLRRWRESCDSG